MVTWTGKRIASLSLYTSNKTPSLLKIGYEHFAFGICYAICLYYCYITLGEQYYEALSMYENQEINVLDDYEKLRNRAEDFLTGNLPDPSTVTSSSNANPNYVVPSKWSPGFWPSVALGLVATCHALFVLGQIWSVKFKCLVKFSTQKDATKATHAHIVPSSHQGKQLLVPIQCTKDGALYFDFHRRKYLYDVQTDCFQKVKCRVDYSVGHYTEWKGVNSELMHAQLIELYGPNRFQMVSPSFMDMYYEQVTGPFTMFQVFTTLLWCLDSYWQYSLFNFFMIFMFEATTVFSRQRSLGVIKNMGNEITPIMVYRCGKWINVTTEDLVPGFSSTTTLTSSFLNILQLESVSYI